MTSSYRTIIRGGDHTAAKQCSIISVFNQKGGVGKTATVVNLAACLTRLGKKVLVVDFDPQANATRYLLSKTPERTVLHCLQGKALIEDAICKTDLDRLDLLPSDIMLSETEAALTGESKRETLLKERLGRIIRSYDYILIDCQPSLGLLPVMALAASTDVIVPVECQFLSLKGLHDLLETVQLAKEKFNSHLDLMGILCTKFHARSKANQEVLRYVQELLAEELPVFRSVIPRDVKAEEAPSHSMPLCLYSPSSRALKAYFKLAREVTA